MSGAGNCGREVRGRQGFVGVARGRARLLQARRFRANSCGRLRRRRRCHGCHVSRHQGLTARATWTRQTRSSGRWGRPCGTCAQSGRRAGPPPARRPRTAPRPTPRPRRARRARAWRVGRAGGEGESVGAAAAAAAAARAAAQRSAQHAARARRRPAGAVSGAPRRPPRTQLEARPCVYGPHLGRGATAGRATTTRWPASAVHRPAALITVCAA
jgi:hypothetical protein